MKTIKPTVISTGASNSIISNEARSAKSRNLFPAAVAALCLLTACTDLTIHDDAEGVTPEAGQAYTSLRAERVTGQSIAMTLTLGETADSEEADLYLRSSQPFEKSGTVWLDFAGEEFVKAYSESKGIEYKLLPAAFYSLKGGNSIDISAGSMETGRNSLVITTKNLFGNVIAPGRYLLPVICDGSSVCEVNETTILIDLTVREPYTDPDGYPLCTDKNIFTVFFLNTSVFDPRLANDMVIMTDWGDRQAPQYGIGNIVNLRSSSVHYDIATGTVSVLPSNDLRYVLEHYTERVLPVQESGRKVCVCIEGGGKGIGFCNFTDEQIADFTASVKRMVDTYGLDGINLWDRNTGYDRAVENGFQEMNTTSYPKLIRTLRKTLGPDKLITVTDHEAPTAYFHDTEATGGIAVGEYIDYAWHGYYNNSEPMQVVDPWNQGLESVSSIHPRQPFAGLGRNRYGVIHGSPRKYKNGIFDDMKNWYSAGNYNGIIVFSELRSNIQDQYEGNIQYPGDIIQQLLNNDGKRFGQNVKRLDVKNATGYGKWLKDW